MTMRRALAMAMASALLAGCPSTAMNRPAPASDAAGELADVGGEDVVGDADAGDAAGDASVGSDVGDASEVGDAADAGDTPGVQMTIEFGSVALHGSSRDGVVNMRASVTWNHVPRRH